MSKAHRGQKDYLCVELDMHALTAELVLVEEELLQVREVADGRRNGACAWAREFLCMTGSTRTAKLVFHEIERLQVREVADGRRDGACAWAREVLCMSGKGTANLGGRSCSC